MSCTIPLRVLELGNIFIPLWCSFREQTYLMKVFCFILDRESGKFMCTRITITLVTCIGYVYFSTYHTGVGYCLFVHGYSRTFDQIDKQLHTFFFNKITIKELDGNKIIQTMLLSTKHDLSQLLIQSVIFSLLGITFSSCNLGRVELVKEDIVVENCIRVPKQDGELKIRYYGKDDDSTRKL